MASGTTTELLRVLGGLALLSQTQKLALQQLSQRRSGPQALVQDLVQRGWLTAYQGQHLLQGQSDQLMLGPYVILDVLGDGGMGRVFKARHPALDRLAAVKVLRKELVGDEETLQRFLREIKIASQLARSPYLVHAFDAGPVNGTYFLAMEYIEGIDLHRLVEKTGPLPMREACDYIRQAALGLQHAHEHGLVHRDIKPANLLVAPRPGTQKGVGNTVKILDLGLARLQSTGTGAGRTILTTDGSVSLGTIDYQAPEQALDFHRADIRADIYSLGCTLFYLLTGKPPFGEAPLAVKLMRHQQAEPPDVKERRRDVPDELVPIVRRMLAKKPADRYKTPGEVVAALARLFPARPTPQAAPSSGSRSLSLLSQGTRLAFRLMGATARAAWKVTRRRPRLVLGGMVSVALGMVLVWWLLGPRAPLGPLLGTPITELSAEKALARLRGRADDSGADRQALWRDVLAFRMKHAGTAEATAAAELQMRLPSLLDNLDPARIKDQTGMPAEAVALIQGHHLAENDLKFSPDGRMIALCGDNTHLELALYDLTGSEPKLLANLTGHTAPLNAVAFSPDGQLVVSASADKTVRLWDLRDGKPRSLRVLEGHTKSVTCLAFSPDGKTLASGSEDKTVRLWRVATAEQPAPTVLPTSRVCVSLAISSDGTTLAAGSKDGNGSSVQLWNLNTREAKERRTWEADAGLLAISPNAPMIAEGDARGGAVTLRGFSETEPEGKVPHWHDKGARKVQFTPDGKAVFTCDGVCRLGWWDLASMKRLFFWHMPMSDPNPRVELAPDGRHFAIAPHVEGGRVYIIRLPKAPTANR